MLNTLSATLTKSEETVRCNSMFSSVYVSVFSHLFSSSFAIQIEKLQSDKEAVEAAKRDFEESMTQTQQEVQSLTQLTPEQVSFFSSSLFLFLSMLTSSLYICSSHVLSGWRKEFIQDFGSFRNTFFGKSIMRMQKLSKKS